MEKRSFWHFMTVFIANNIFLFEDGRGRIKLFHRYHISR